MKILVTGGLGFIGSNFIRLLLKKTNYDIINLDKVTYAGNPANLKDIEEDKRYTFVKGDICDKEIVERCAEKADIIVNFAAETHVDRSITQAEDFVKTDILGVFNILEAVNKFKIKKLIHISTDEVYGSIEKGSFIESGNLNPSSPYSASKSCGDLLALSYSKTYKTPVIITRSSNNYGSYQYPEKLIPLIITNALENKNIPIYGDGNNVRDWLYVEDNCEGILIVMEKGICGEIYNISSGIEKTNLYVTKEILKILKKPESLITYVKDRPGHDKRYSIDSSKLRKLGWISVHLFNEGLKKTVEWYKKNEEWWKPIKSGEFKEYYKSQYSIK